MDDRTISGIALGPDTQSNNRWLFLSLQTGRKVSRHWWQELPTTPEVIERVHALADHERDADANALPDPFLFEWAPNVPINDVPLVPDGQVAGAANDDDDDSEAGEANDGDENDSDGENEDGENEHDGIYSDGNNSTDENGDGAIADGEDT